MFRRNHIFLLALSIPMFLTLLQCQSTSAEDSSLSTEYAEGKSLADKYCVACHASAGPSSMRVAPPLVAVRDHYLDAFSDEASFVHAMVDFIRYPEESKSLMPGAVKRFGLMPSLIYSEDKLEAIATYLYHEEPPMPKGYREKHREGKGKEMHGKRSGQPSDEVVSLAMQTKKALGSQLMQAMEREGAAGAVDFCNIKAIPITDSMSTHLGVSVRRVSDRPRNPDNAATAFETKILQRMHRQMAKRGDAMAVSDSVDGRLRHYIPITTNAMCLQCHGNPDEHINDETFDIIAARYPNDLAIGYDVEQIRGMFVIEQ